ncbi:ATP-binding protein [Ruania rhizosphaerae]|uniref:ATP-binding protein n=1 Tax=Ruania rhizosphaerae TaxID=1840413 RepID=UPI001F488B5C|nr:AAA family ATPase [Ruania rhizosphaerae]
MNPFTPGFGVTPPLLVGREHEIDDFRVALQEGIGAIERITLVTGLRGTGKTVMLNAYEDVAKSEGWVVLSETAGRGVLNRLTHTAVPEALRMLEPNQTQSRITGLSVGGGFGAQRQVKELNEPEPNFRSRMNQLLDAMSPETGVLITIDEIHRDDDIELLGSTLQHLRREGRHVAFVAAGLPSMVQDLLASTHASTFLRRADRRHLGSVSEDDVRQALRVPISHGDRTISDHALSAAVAGTQGYPFMIQLVGQQAWRAAHGEHEISSDHVERGVAQAQRKIGQLVHAPAMADLSPTDRSFLIAMADDAQGPSRMADIAARLGVNSSYAGQYRMRLIDAEVIEPAGYGKVEFTIPYLRQYLREHATADLRHF